MENFPITDSIAEALKCGSNGISQIIVRQNNPFVFIAHKKTVWLLEIGTADKLAVCLMIDGERQKYKIIELNDPPKLHIDWTHTYSTGIAYRKNPNGSKGDPLFGVYFFRRVNQNTQEEKWAIPYDLFTALNNLKFK